MPEGIQTTVQTDNEPRTHAERAQAFKEEFEEKREWIRELAKQATEINDSDEPLMAVKDLFPDGVDTEEARLKYSQQMEFDCNKLQGKVAVRQQLASLDGMSRDMDAVFEMGGYGDIAAMREDATKNVAQTKARSAWDTFETRLKAYTEEYGSNGYSPQLLTDMFTKSRESREGVEGILPSGARWNNGLPGFSFPSEETEMHGAKAQFTSLIQGSATTGPGIQPYPVQMDTIVEQALRQPSYFMLLPSRGIPTNSYQFREETSNTESFQYYNEWTGSATRPEGTDIASEVQFRITPETKTLKTITGKMLATYEQLFSEPMARSFMQNRLVRAAERWLDGELVAAGTDRVWASTGTAKRRAKVSADATLSNVTSYIRSLADFSQDGTTAISNDAWGGPFNNLFKKTSSTSESALQMILKAMIHMEDEDEGMSMANGILMKPGTYEKLVNVPHGSADARWLFPSVLSNNTAVTPFGLPIIHNKGGLNDDEVMVIDLNHHSFVSHVQGLVFESDREIQKLQEVFVVHVMCELDVWRRHSVQRMQTIFA